MTVGRDLRVSRWFWRIKTPRHRWSVRAHFWLVPGNMLRWNRQPRFAEIMACRCLVFCHASLGRPDHPAARRTG